MRVHQPEAVRPEHPHPVLVGQLAQPPFEHGSLQPHLLEAGADDHDSPDTLLTAFLHHLQDGLGRDDDDGHLHRPWHVRHAGVAPQAHDLIVARVHRVQGALEPRFDHVPKDDVPYLGPVRGGADDRYARRFE